MLFHRLPFRHSIIHFGFFEEKKLNVFRKELRQSVEVRYAPHQVAVLLWADEDRWSGNYQQGPLDKRVGNVSGQVQPRPTGPTG